MNSILHQNLSIKFDFFYILVDIASTQIVCGTTNSASAKAISMHNQRLRIFPLETNQPWLGEEFKNASFNDISKNFTFKIENNNRILTKLEDATITEKFTNLRKETMMRMAFHESLHSFCKITLSLVADSEFHVDFANSINNELLKCNTDDGKYTDSICAYAEITACDPFTATEELTLHMNSLTQVRLRTLGYYIKYRNLLNDAPSRREEFLKILIQAKNEIFFNAMV